jgi:hypothetical protein
VVSKRQGFTPPNYDSQTNKKLAFESVRAITQLFEGGWRGKQEIAVDNALDLTMAVSSPMWLAIGVNFNKPFWVALMTISAAGFGHQISWEDDEVPPGHKLSFKQSVEIIGTGIFVRLICPKCLFEWAPIEKIREA